MTAIAAALAAVTTTLPSVSAADAAQHPGDDLHLSGSPSILPSARSCMRVSHRASASA